MDEFRTTNDFIDGENISVSKDSSPTFKESIFGIILGVAYLTITSIIPAYILLFLLGNYSTESGLYLVNGLAQIMSGLITVGLMSLVPIRVLREYKLKLDIKILLKGLVFALIAYATAIFLNLLDLTLFGESDTNANQGGIEQMLTYHPVLTIIYCVIIAPITEELIFRYYIYKFFAKKNVILGVVISAVAFGLVHMLSTFINFAGDGNVAVLLNDLRSLPSYIASGVIFAIAYAKTNSIQGNISAHMIYNTIATYFMVQSMALVPVKINTVTSYDEVTINVEVNETNYYDLTIYKIELVELNVDEDIAARYVYDVNFDDDFNYLFNEQEEYTWYQCNIYYRYKYTSSSEYIEDIISTQFCFMEGY